MPKFTVPGREYECLVCLDSKGLPVVKRGQGNFYVFDHWVPCPHCQEGKHTWGSNKTCMCGKRQDE